MASNINLSKEENEAEVQPSTSAQASSEKNALVVSEEDFCKLNADYRAYLINSSHLFFRINHVYLRILHAFGSSDLTEPSSALFHMNIAIAQLDQEPVGGRVLGKFDRFCLGAGAGLGGLRGLKGAPVAREAWTRC